MRKRDSAINFCVGFVYFFISSKNLFFLLALLILISLFFHKKKYKLYNIKIDAKLLRKNQ